MILSKDFARFPFFLYYEDCRLNALHLIQSFCQRSGSISRIRQSNTHRMQMKMLISGFSENSPSNLVKSRINAPTFIFLYLVKYLSPVIVSQSLYRIIRQLLNGFLILWELSLTLPGNRFGTRVALQCQTISHLMCHDKTKMCSDS